MKASQILLLGLLIAAATCTFKFNFGGCRVENYDAWDSVEFPVEGGSGDYDYEFENLPRNWYANRGKVYAPKGDIDAFKYFSLKIKVFDRVSRSSVKRCVLFNFKNRRISNIFDTDYEFDLNNSYQVEQFIYKREKGYSYKPAPTPVPEPVPTHEFPSDERLEEIIVKGDVAWIKRIIDESIGSGLKCKNIADFLSRVLSLVQVHISIFRNDAENIRQDIFKLEEELNFLLTQLEELENNSYDVERLRYQLQKFRADLDIQIGQRQRLRAEISSNEEKIDENQA